MDPVTLRELVPPDAQPWVFAVLLAMLTIAVLEGVIMSRTARDGYDWWAFAASIADALGRRVTELLTTSLGLAFAAPVLSWLYEHRLGTISMDTWWAFALLFIGQEFCYYWYHRTSHRVRWFWATHSVHHSPNQLTLATAVRLGWTGKITGTAIFFAPLVWIGFSPIAVAVAVGANLLYQFWLHTTWIPKLGAWFEWSFNSPSNHRVHHGCNPEYLDCNYGGVLVVFDRAFGTYVEERSDLPPKYGLTTPLLTRNPIAIAFHEWGRLLQDLRAARSPADVWEALFAPPRAHRDVAQRTLTTPH